MALRLTNLANSFRLIGLRAMSTGEFGSGAGKGGGSGGSIREAGGGFGKMEAAHEEEFFRKQRVEQLKAMKEHLEEESKFHDQEIAKHEEAIKRHKKRIHDIHAQHGSDSD